LQEVNKMPRKSPPQQQGNDCLNRGAVGACLKSGKLAEENAAEDGEARI
jgi:hypothetical protein